MWSLADSLHTTYLDCKSGALSDPVARQMAALRLRRERMCFG